MLEFLYGEEDLNISEPNWPFDLIYEDDLVVVYDLQRVLPEIGSIR
jgi:hypothetical protein